MSTEDTGPETVLLAGETWKAALIPKVLEPDEILKWGELHTDHITDAINKSGSFTPGLLLLGNPTKSLGPEQTGDVTVQLAMNILKYIAPDSQDDAGTMAGELTRIAVTALLEAEGYAVMVAMPAFVPEDDEAAKSLSPGGDYETNDDVIEALIITVETMQGMVSMRMFAIDRDENSRASVAAELEMNDFQKKLFPRFLETAVEFAKQKKGKR